MKPEQQRIAIAEWCGWELDMAPYGPYTKKGEKGLWTGHPDYPNDLNAMHEAESTITDESKRDAYCLQLATSCNSLSDWNFDSMKVEAWKTIRAAAAQRAEALLRTIGRWKDDNQPHQKGES